MEPEEGYTLIVGLGTTGMSCVRHLAAGASHIAVVDSREAPPALNALRAEYPQISPALGTFEPALFRNARQIVLSPGVSPADPVIQRARELGVPVIGDIELFARVVNAPVAAITGSNGKSTVTSLLGEMIRCAGKRVRVGGNLGPPALSLLQGDAPDLYLLELSSFQLETTHSLQPVVSAVLNISHDHMDRHESFDAYVAAKKRIFAGGGAMVLNLDDALVAAMAETGRRRIGFTLSAPGDGDFGLREVDGATWIARGTEPLLPTSGLPLAGRHNVANALAALAMAEALNIPDPARRQGISRFRGLPHRCELVADKNTVRWYDDSKGTNVGATVAAIHGLGKEYRLVLIAGGDGKGADFTPLRDPVKQHVREVVLFGRDAPIIGRALAETAPVRFARDLETAVETAAAAARSGDAVLFSPACASFDMFADYVERGQAFCRAVKEVTAS